MRRTGFIGSITMLAIWAQCAEAQMSAPPIRSALPQVSQISVANAAGVLNYCERKALVSVVSTDVVLSGLPNKPDVRSADYVAGQGGQIRGDGGKNLSLSSAPKHLQSEACDMVLQRAKMFRPQG